MEQEKYLFDSAVDDPLTSKEKKFRDNLLERIFVTRLLRFRNAANFITILGYCLAFFAMYDFFATRSLFRQFFILAFSWLTDLIDGPIARKNNNVTLIGTILDHCRDGMLIAWMVFLVFFNLPSLSPAYSIFYYLILSAFSVFVIILGVNIKKFWVLRKKMPQFSEMHFLTWFWTKKMTTTAIGRFTFASFAISIITFFLSFSFQSSYFSQIVFKIGAFLFAFHLIFLGAYLYETLLEPHEKIKSQEKIIKKLESLIRRK